MSYGVNQWGAPRGRARAAGTRKRKSTRTAKRKKASSARRAKKKSGSKKQRAKKVRAPRARKARAPKKAKARKFARYDPETGRKVSVTEDDPRYDWPSRKPSKSSKLAAKIREHPVDYALERATKVATSRGRTISRGVGRKLTGVVTGGASAAAIVGTVAASAAILAAGYVVMDHVAKEGTLTVGEKVNRISTEFVGAQKRLAAAFGVSSWQQVPQDVRDRAVSDYKRALGTATSQARGRANVSARAEGSYK